MITSQITQLSHFTITDKNKSSMEKELRDIFEKHNQGWGMIDMEEAIKDILLLFSVSGRSEQLCQCKDTPTKHFIKNWCDDCKKHIV